MTAVLPHFAHGWSSSPVVDVVPGPCPIRGGSHDVAGDASSP